jgi:hypothetical protein
MTYTDRLAACATRVERRLERWLPSPDTEPGRLHEAMRYAVLGGGKRVRPALVYFSGAALGVPDQRLDGPAAAVELIHAYSLVHDDLPAMDDDDLRRGRPTCHRAYDEATAILVGDALQVLAFEILAEDPDMVSDPARRLEIVRLLARASGTGGMAGRPGGGSRGRRPGPAAGGTGADAPPEDRRADSCLRHDGGGSADHLAPELAAALDNYGSAIGLAFQIQDDILDVEGENRRAGQARAGGRGARQAELPEHCRPGGGQGASRPVARRGGSRAAALRRGGRPLALALRLAHGAAPLSTPLEHASRSARAGDLNRGRRLADNWQIRCHPGRPGQD